MKDRTSKQDSDTSHLTRYFLIPQFRKKQIWVTNRLIIVEKNHNEKIAITSYQLIF